MPILSLLLSNRQSGELIAGLVNNHDGGDDGGLPGADFARRLAEEIGQREASATSSGFKSLDRRGREDDQVR
jgi:hypothetical protein